jgi:serine/threonine protein kinase
MSHGMRPRVYLGASKDPNAHPLHRTVAIKIIGVPAQASKAEYTKKLVKEVRLHKAVVHLNVLRLLQWSEGATSESMWIVLEYCFGGDLFDKISASRVRSVRLLFVSAS